MHLDEMEAEKKVAVKKWVKKKYKTNMGLPFVVFRIKGQDYVSNGYDPEYWKSKV